jgi:hypothetical protein
MIFLFLFVGYIVSDKIKNYFAINNTRPLEYKIIIIDEDYEVIEGFNLFVRANDTVFCDLYFINETNKIFSWNGTSMNKYVQTQKNQYYILLISTQSNRSVDVKVWYDEILGIGALDILGFTILGITGFIVFVAAIGVAVVSLGYFCLRICPLLYNNCRNRIEDIKKRRIEKLKKRKKILELKENLIEQ